MLFWLSQQTLALIESKKHSAYSGTKTNVYQQNVATNAPMHRKIYQEQ